MITIDGSKGEGGGQILRTALALSLLTGASFSIEKIRAGRSKPGLMRQHLACVRAAATIGDAEVDGAEIGARMLTFRPGRVRAGNYRFDTGGAGSTTLVWQTVLMPLLSADAPSRDSDTAPAPASRSSARRSRVSLGVTDGDRAMCRPAAVP